MKRIASFTINHNTLQPGLYISRVDGDIITYDLRTNKPNAGSYLDNDEMHTFEHLFATYVRNSGFAKGIVYFGPMGCQTGFYLLVRHTITSNQVITLVQDTLKFIEQFEGEIPGSSEKECGNAKSHSLPKAKALAKRMRMILQEWPIENLQYKN